MDPLLGAAALLGLGYAAYRAARGAGNAAPRVPVSTPGRAAAIRRRLAEARRRQVARAQGEALLRALAQLDRAPDFRRAASVAAAATAVPAAARRRLFAQVRPRLVRHFARCLAAGAAPATLADSLSTLVAALAVARFEADYVRAAAARLARPRPVPTPAERAGTLRRDHEARVAAARQAAGHAPDLLEQLLEAEDLRYRQALLALFEDPPGRADRLPQS